MAIASSLQALFEFFRSYLKSFPPDTYKFLELRYGLRTGRPLSLREAGKRWKGVSRQRAHQILSRTLDQLKRVEATFLPLYHKGVREILHKYGGLITLSNFQKEWRAYAPSPHFGAGILWLLNDYFHHK
ncbi:MAG: sigma factor-like helix-turn-helix DNA-binding protein, partial [bacterium]